MAQCVTIKVDTEFRRIPYNLQQGILKENAIKILNKNMLIDRFEDRIENKYSFLGNNTSRKEIVNYINLVNRRK